MLFRSDLDLIETLRWNIDQDLPYTFSFVTNKNNEVTHVSLLDVEDSDYVFFEIPVKPPFTHRLELPGKEFRDTEYVDMTVDSEGISFIDHSRKIHVMENQKWLGEKLVIKDEKRSKRIRRHEEQHQFNKLFVPKEHYYGTSSQETKHSMHLLKSLAETMDLTQNSEEDAAEAKRKIIEI